MSVLVLLLLLASPAHAAESVRDVPDDGVATCLRDVGAGGLLSLQAPVTQASSPTDLLTATPEKVERTTGADLGALDTCPEVAGGGDTTILAGFARGRVEGPERFVTTVTVRVAVRVGDGEFGAPVTLDEIAAADTGEIAVAAGAGGDAVVAWREFRRSRTGGLTAVRILASRRGAGADPSWTKPEEVVPWTKLDDLPEGLGGSGQAHVAAGVDAAGRTTIAWAVGAPPRDRGRIDHLSDVGVATGARGEALGRVRLVRGVQDVERLAFAVAPDGGALLVVPTSFELAVWERRPGGDAFAKALAIDEEGGPHDPAVALDPSGAAVVAYRFAGALGDPEHDRDGVKALRRGPSEQFGPPTVVWSRPTGRSGFGSSVLVGFAAGEPPEPPRDTVPLRVALSRTGRVAITWAGERRVVEDRVASLYVATGGLIGDLTATRVGTPCRPVTSATPFVPARGDTAAAAWADNSGDLLGIGFEFPAGGGRLHVTDSPGGTPAGTAPEVNIDGPRGTQRLWTADPLEVAVSCDAPCDLRVFLPGRRGPRAGLGTSLASAGTKRVRIHPGLEPLARRRPAETTVLVHACPRDGTARSRDKVRVRLVRPKPPPVPAPVGVRTRREGGDVVVTWRTEFPARRTRFVVTGTERRRLRYPDDIAYASADGRQRTSFRVRLPHRRGLRVNWVTVTAASTEYGGRPRDVVVPVAR